MYPQNIKFFIVRSSSYVNHLLGWGDFDKKIMLNKTPLESIHFCVKVAKIGEKNEERRKGHSLPFSSDGHTFVYSLHRYRSR
jgi:hypothetical protein